MKGKGNLCWLGRNRRLNGWSLQLDQYVLPGPYSVQHEVHVARCQARVNKRICESPLSGLNRAFAGLWTDQFVPMQLPESF